MALKLRRELSYLKAYLGQQRKPGLHEIDSFEVAKQKGENRDEALVDRVNVHPCVHQEDLVLAQHVLNLRDKVRQSASTVRSDIDLPLLSLHCLLLCLNEVQVPFEVVLDAGHDERRADFLVGKRARSLSERALGGKAPSLTGLWSAGCQETSDVAVLEHCSDEVELAPQLRLNRLWLRGNNWGRLRCLDV